MSVVRCLLSVTKKTLNELLHHVLTIKIFF